MTQSVIWNFLENWGRSLNDGDYTNAGWTFAGTSGSDIVYDVTLGKNAFLVYGSFPSAPKVSRSLSWYGGIVTRPTASVRFYLPPSQSSGQCSFSLNDNLGSIMASVVIDSNSAIMTISDGVGVKYTSSLPVIQFGVPYFLEISMTPSETAGIIEVRLNEQIVGSILAGLNTDPNNIGNVNSLVFSSNNSNAHMLVTDIGVFDAAVSGNPQFYGDNNVQYLAPVSNGGTVQFAPHGLAANWQNAASIPPNTSNYNFSSTVGATDQFTVGNLSVLTESVGGIFIVSTAENISGGLHTYSRQWGGAGGSAIQSGSASTLTNGYLTYGDSPSGDPNTNAAWTVAGVNGMTIGYSLAS